MNELLSSIVEKVSSYNLFNYLLTGAVFFLGLDRITRAQFTALPLMGFVPTA